MCGVSDTLAPALRAVAAARRRLLGAGGGARNGKRSSSARRFGSDRASPRSRTMSDSAGLDGLVVLVTGASSGLGEQLARSLVAARRAARARGPPRRSIAGARNRARRRRRHRRLRRDRRGRPERLIETVIGRHGRIDGLVNNAGLGAAGPALRTSVETFSRVLDVNLVAPFALSCLAARTCEREGAARSSTSPR